MSAFTGSSASIGSASTGSASTIIGQLIRSNTQYYNFEGDIQMIPGGQNEHELYKEYGYSMVRGDTLPVHSRALLTAHIARYEIVKLNTLSDSQSISIQKAAKRAGSSIAAVAEMVRNQRGSEVTNPSVKYNIVDETVDNLENQLRKGLALASCCTRVFYRLGWGKLAQKYYDIEALRLLRSCYYLRNKV